MLAIGLYTYDLSIGRKQEQNFFYILSQMLRQRNNEKLNQWKGFLFYFQQGLSKLPNFEGTVYRGVPNAKTVITTSYKKGRRIHWSSYSSTTINSDTAKKFCKK
eukprot:TRINITY_DN10371_c0_g1_i1.p1 TRINITY_DN10371_c0_g1~~TRINITY_DN10371_c0_g1_i1.p1  ORF type:complete len:116 (-),score=19.06 TRINITY_DN10371_c0_g1_i1:18-329(-)